ncbi:MAG: YceI family protein [Planctomycetota bacterium]|jgi:polyisoprenoid-binding protein YceI
MRKKMLYLPMAALAVVAWLQTPSTSGPKAESTQVDGHHSSIVFKVGYFNASNFYGRFNRVKGSVVTNDDGVGSIDLTVDAGSVDTGIADRDKHLKSPDFFNTKQFPVITFKSDSVKAAGGDKYTATGTLTLHGVSKEITVDFTRVGRGKGRKGESRTGFDANFTLKRSDYGMKFMVGPLSDEITLMISLAAIVQ